MKDGWLKLGVVVIIVLVVLLVWGVGEAIKKDSRPYSVEISDITGLCVELKHGYPVGYVDVAFCAKVAP